jgi:hypothetical protein
VLEFLHELNTPWDEIVCAAAARRGDFPMLQWLHKHGCVWDAECICTWAAVGGSTALVTWLLEQPNIVIDAHTMRTAAQSGRLSVCQLLHAHACEWDESACNAAALGGHTNVLRWLSEHGCPYDSTAVCLQAANGGSVPTINYVLSQHTVSEELLMSMLDAAGANSKLAAARCLREQHSAAWPPLLVYDYGYMLSAWSAAALQWAR